MGKPTGFLEYERRVSEEIAPLERIKNFNEFHASSGHPSVFPKKASDEAFGAFFSIARNRNIDFPQRNIM